MRPENPRVLAVVAALVGLVDALAAERRDGEGDELVSLADAGIERRALRRLQREGRLPVERIGRRLYTRRSALLALVGVTSGNAPKRAPARIPPRRRASNTGALSPFEGGVHDGRGLAPHFPWTGGRAAPTRGDSPPAWLRLADLSRAEAAKYLASAQQAAELAAQAARQYARLAPERTDEFERAIGGLRSELDERDGQAESVAMAGRAKAGGA